MHIWSYELPWTYLPTWFGNTLPDLYLVALACSVTTLGVFVLRRSAERALNPTALLCVALCVAAVAVPLLGVVLLRPVLYDAWC